MDIKLHPEHGVNPMIEKCYICGKDKGILMLGDAYKGKAPVSACVNRNPCDDCKDAMKMGIWIIETLDGEEGKTEPYRTGRMWLVKESVFERVINDYQVLKRVLNQRVVFMEVSTVAKLGIE